MNTPEDTASAGSQHGQPVDAERAFDQYTAAPRSHPADSSYVPGFPPTQPATRTPTTHNRYFWLTILIFAFAYLVLWVVGDLVGEASELRLFAVSGLESLPFLPLCLFAYLGRRSLWARVLCGAYWLALIGSMALFVWLLTLESMAGPAAMERLTSGETPGAGLPTIDIADLARGCICGYGVGFAVLLGLLGFTPEVRRVVARVLPIDPDSFVHATAVATVFGLTALAFVPLATLGQPPLLMLARAAEAIKEAGATSDGAELRSTIYGFFWLVPATIVAVGYPVERTFSEALRRAGLVRPRVWQAALAVLLIPILVLTMNELDRVFDQIWKKQGWPNTDTTAFDELMKFAINPLGAVIIGVTAGLGEELAVRGVLQPRLGILLSNVFFTSLHALQYNWDGLVSVFLIGLFLGVLRKFTNTTTSAIVHGGYDFTLVMLEVLAGRR
jgi:hypothetical protein